MKYPLTQGFTIIETMLFLSISGLLTVGVLVSAGVSINTQRYRDAVVSLQTEIQDIYFGVQNVYNDRTQAYPGCANVNDESASIHRGQSRCVIIGKYFTVTPTGETSSYAVIGHPTGFDSRTATDDLEVMRGYAPRAVADSREDSKIEWGARLSWPKSGAEAASPTTPRSLAILVMRSPLSGALYTFTSDTVSLDVPGAAALQAMVINERDGANHGMQARTVCVEAGDFTVAEPTAIYIGAQASSSNAIEVRTNNLLLAFGGSGASSC